MIYAGSIILIKKNSIDAVKKILDRYPQVEVYVESKDKQQLVTAIEEESSHSLEELCEELKENDEILDISHTNFYFGGEVETMLKPS